jgi:methylthioribose-1-phosphate isomerase
MHLKTIEWISDRPGAPVPGRARMIDQTKLPGELVYLETADVKELWRAIKTLQVRGAPAIGVAAAMGVVIAVQNLAAESGEEVFREVSKAADYLAKSRPTAINLFWALERMKKVAAAAMNKAPDELKRILAEEAVKIRDEDAAMCRSIGRHGATLLEDGFTILTHCNAGGLATAEYGTALAPVYVAKEQGKTIHVFADETRPLLQGSRLTAWELMQAGIDVTLICDNTAAHVMREGKIDAVLVGADRIAANGDTANKVGTYGVAVSARAHHIPFYVLAPTSSWDLAIRSGEEIPIEHRDRLEVVKGFGALTAPEHVKVYSPAFDVTPAGLITAIVCEKGIAKPPFEKTLKELVCR